MSSDYPPMTLVRNRAYLVMTAVRRVYFRRVWGMQVGRGVRISLTAKIDKTNPHGIVIGDYSAIAFGAAVLSHNFLYSRHETTTIGSNTFIGARAIIMPGVTVGDGCIVSALSLVARDVPSGCVVMGNPARIVEKGITTGRWGNRVDVEETA